MAYATVHHSADHLQRLAVDVLRAAGCATENAEAAAEALIRAELDGLPRHGLERLPQWADEVAEGRIDGWAQPEANMPSQTAVRVDARGGFTFPAIAYAIAAAEEVVDQMGMAAVAVVDGRHHGVAGQHVERMAERGMVALMFGSADPAMLAFACPRLGLPPLVIDLSLSVAPRARIGAALALAVDILAAGLTGAALGYEAGREGSAGLMFLALDPDLFGTGGAIGRIEGLLQAVLTEEGMPLPGERRLDERARRRGGISVPQALYDELLLRSHRNVNRGAAKPPAR
jgi:(2R)-3-sulfolactate dehydrogenase (NADP+)